MGYLWVAAGSRQAEVAEDSTAVVVEGSKPFVAVAFVAFVAFAGEGSAPLAAAFVAVVGRPAVGTARCSASVGCYNHTYFYFAMSCLKAAKS